MYGILAFETFGVLLKLHMTATQPVISEIPEFYEVIVFFQTL